MTARGFWSGKDVLVTGHTGFKGSWLVLWLRALGARVAGYALGPPSEPSLWDQLNLASEIRTDTADIRDLERLMRVFREFRPQIVFHLAAQSLVRPSYEDPVTTYSTNVMGTVNVLEAVRRSGSARVVINVTSDKCYENREWERGYRENDAMGGYDPYSSSKGCAELVTTAYRNSFFNPGKYQEHGVALASVRAGNVIGGGDWARDRLVPDVMRAALRGEPHASAIPMRCVPGSTCWIPCMAICCLRSVHGIADRSSPAAGISAPGKRMPCRYIRSPISWFPDGVTAPGGLRSRESIPTKPATSGSIAPKRGRSLVGAQGFPWRTRFPGRWSGIAATGAGPT